MDTCTKCMWILVSNVVRRLDSDYVVSNVQLCVQHKVDSGNRSRSECSDVLTKRFNQYLVDISTREHQFRGIGVHEPTGFPTTVLKLFALHSLRHRNEGYSYSFSFRRYKGHPARVRYPEGLRRDVCRFLLTFYRRFASLSKKGCKTCLVR